MPSTATFKPITTPLGISTFEVFLITAVNVTSLPSCNSCSPFSFFQDSFSRITSYPFTSASGSIIPPVCNLFATGKPGTTYESSTTSYGIFALISGLLFTNNGKVLLLLSSVFVPKFPRRTFENFAFVVLQKIGVIWCNQLSEYPLIPIRFEPRISNPLNSTSCTLPSKRTPS